jgi:tyrosine-protein kinase Etk/Wzc
MNGIEESTFNRDKKLQKVNIIDFLIVIAKYKKFIIRFVLLILLSSIILFYLILPRWYKSVAVVMPPKQKNTLGLINSITRAAAPLRSLGVGGVTDDLAQFQAILNSRRVMETVVNQFDLLSVYGLKSVEKTIKELEGNCAFSLGKEDVALEISVYDTDPKRAANMANYFVEALNKTYLEMSVTEARSNREFIETRLTKVYKDLNDTEDAFKRYQQRSEIAFIPEQGGNSISAVAELIAMKVKKELEVGIIEQSSGPDNEFLRQLKGELKEIKKKVDLIPEAGMQAIRLYRNMVTQEKILEYIVPLYEQAKIEEQRNTPTVIVLDTAVPAEKPSKPKRMLIISLIGFISTILGYFIALILDALQRSRDNKFGDHLEKLNYIKRELSIKRLFR